MKIDWEFERYARCPRRDPDLIFSLQFERTVKRDDTVSFQNLAVQVDKVGWRGTLAGCWTTLRRAKCGGVKEGQPGLDHKLETATRFDTH